MQDIFQAILAKNTERVKEILISEPAAIDAKDEEEGVWAPFLAARTGCLELVQYIVEYSRASLNATDELNQNILHHAARSNNPELIKYLTERAGISPRTGDRYGRTPIDIAVEFGNDKVVRYLREEQGINLDRMYRNPVVTGAHPDPSIIRVDEDYYMVNSTFIYFPAIPILHSRDLVHWRIIGHGITEPDYLELDGLEDGRGIWAPDISYYKGRFYIVATYRLNDGGPVCRRQLVVSSDRPEGPYSRPFFIDEDGIDPSLFTDDDGRRYMLLNRGARIFEVSGDCTRKLSEAGLLWYGDNKRAPEGPHMIKKDGYYFLFLAEGGTGMGHRISVARSRELMGIYESCPYNPIMLQTDPAAYIQRTGHGKPVRTRKGDWYMVYLCGRRVGEGYTILGRETALDPIAWTADGWPLVNGGRGPSVLQDVPDIPVHPWEAKETDHFDGEKLGLDWMFVRTPPHNGYSLQNSCLRLYGGGYDLDSQRCKSLIVRRQKDFCFTAETKLCLYRGQNGWEAGLTGYYDTLTHLKFSVIGSEDGYRLRVMEKNDTREVSHIERVIQAGEELYLKMKTEYLQRSFYYSVDGKAWHELCVLDDVYYLCDEALTKGKRFTGAMVGLYAISVGTYADFDYFRYIKA